MIYRISLLSIVSLLLCAGCNASTGNSEPVNAAPVVPEGMQSLVVGAGCFWCVEAFYERLDGVSEAFSGYAGGSSVNPTYKEVSRGASDHVETVLVIFDPKVISYRELIDFFWTTHDATDGRGVWPDFGPQYRSILLYASEAEKSVITASMKTYEADTGKSVATELKALDTFYAAEEYHQDFAQKNPNHGYIQKILKPKLKKLGFEL